MPVSKDIQDFCDALPGRVAGAVTAAEAALKAQFDTTMAQVQQDHADEVAALKAALDQAAPPAAS